MDLGQPMDSGGSVNTSEQCKMASTTPPSLDPPPLSTVAVIQEAEGDREETLPMMQEPTDGQSASQEKKKPRQFDFSMSVLAY